MGAEVATRTNKWTRLLVGLGEVYPCNGGLLSVKIDKGGLIAQKGG